MMPPAASSACPGPAKSDALFDRLDYRPRQSDAPRHALDHHRGLAGNLLRQAGFDVAERHAIDVDGQRPPFLRQRAGKAVKTGFSRRIIGLPCGAAGRRDRRDIHDLAVNDHAIFAFLRDPAVQKAAQLPQNAERRLKMHVLDGVPLLIADFVQRPIPDVAGIVDQDVDVAELLQRGGDQPAWKVLIGNVARISDRCSRRRRAAIARPLPLLRHLDR